MYKWRAVYTETHTYGSGEGNEELFSISQAWLDVTHSHWLFSSPADIAEEIRERIKTELGLTVSIGVSWNKIFAKFGSDYKKPDAVTVITKENYQDIVWNSPVEDLLFIGRATRRKLNDIGIFFIGQLAKLSEDYLINLFGKVGSILYEFANGLDQSPVKEMAPSSFKNKGIIKSVGNSTTTPRDLISEKEFKLILSQLTESVATRLREIDCYADTVEITIRYNNLHFFTRQQKLLMPTDVTDIFFKNAWNLFEKNYDRITPVRSLGVRVSGLTERSKPLQLNFFGYNEDRDRALDQMMDTVRSRFGNLSLRRGMTIGDSMSDFDPKKDNTVHPVGFFS